MIDVEACRRARPYSPAVMMLRVVWGVGQYLVRWSPRPCFGWRRMVLRLFGAQIGAHVHIYNSAIVYYPWNLTIGDWSSVGEDALIYNLGPVTLGSRVTISHRAHLCAGTHDYRNPSLPLERPPIVINNQAWVCAGAFLGPGVTIGEGAVIGACAVVCSDVAPWVVVMGNPARELKRRVLTPPST